MTNEMETLNSNLLTLPLSERAGLANEFLASLSEPVTFPIGEINFAELERRIAAIKRKAVIGPVNTELLPPPTEEEKQAVERCIEKFGEAFAEMKRLGD